MLFPSTCHTPPTTHTLFTCLRVGMDLYYPYWECLFDFHWNNQADHWRGPEENAWNIIGNYIYIYIYILGFKHDVSCIVRSEAFEWPLSASDLTMHDTSCLNPIITWIIWFWYIMKPKFTSEVPKREVANHALWKIYASFCRSRA